MSEKPSETFAVEMPKIYVCPKCGAVSDGLTNCLHLNTAHGEELRCVECYRKYVQGAEHMQTIRREIPALVKIQEMPTNETPKQEG